MRSNEDSIERLLTAWRDAVRAATVADRLVAEATDAPAREGLRPDSAVDLAELAQLAEQAAAAATRAGERARHAADAYQQAGDRLPVPVQTDRQR